MLAVRNAVHVRTKHCSMLNIYGKDMVKTWKIRSNKSVFSISVHSFISISHCGWSGRDQSPVRRLMWLLERCIQGRFLGVVCHCLPPRLEVPTFTTRRKLE